MDGQIVGKRRGKEKLINDLPSSIIEIKMGGVGGDFLNAVG